jgi:pimeloyl-ACP methyl ester carboxylesterase
VAVQPVEKHFWGLCAENTLLTLPLEVDRLGKARVVATRIREDVGALHRVSYLEWVGEGDGPTLVCMHGVFRNGRDFDFLAQHLASRGWRVVCPDLPGRGRSQSLPGQSLYAFQRYVLDCVSLIARLEVERVSWLGTSLGGLIGMTLAAQDNSPIDRLILNDVGIAPMSDTARAHISGYAASDKCFATLCDLKAELQQIYAPFGDLTDAQWDYLTEHSQWRKDDGTLGLAYDVKAGRQVIQDFAAFDHPSVKETYKQEWGGVWGNVRCPVLILHGERSEVLKVDTAKEMQQMKEEGQVTLQPIANCGHAPPLMSDEQIAIVSTWLEST